MRLLRPIALGAGSCAVFTLSGLSGCLVLPVPVHQSSETSSESRANVGPNTAPRIVPGSTTRTDVLLMLGEPDGRGDDDRWFSYRTHVSRGGWHWAAVWVAAGAGGGGAPIDDWEAVRRLVVRFDERGVVSSVESAQKNCNGCRNVLDAAGNDHPSQP
jgi:outer membrane protein assembly factor BamE (lipoprotein component of BamABCDE complex)